MTNEIIETLANHIAKEILKQPGRKIQETDPLITGGLIDSFHLVDLALYVEDTFGVIIEDQELNADTFDTLKDLAELIQKRQA